MELMLGRWFVGNIRDGGKIESGEGYNEIRVFLGFGPDFRFLGWWVNGILAEIGVLPAVHIDDSPAVSPNIFQIPRCTG
ncbi:hypothetical protein HAX54_006843 [Datura stramonium]|uniref:Uncharacterized protein n=1 Tax=Datura stramonium TaxID=4076 RepID=A0ABS8WWV5_DATST|nr:hypothetical protein [Datura stramonium]